MEPSHSTPSLAAPSIAPAEDRALADVASEVQHPYL